MSQKTITSFFTSRKRAATEDIFSSKNKVLLLERQEGSGKTVDKIKISGKDSVQRTDINRNILCGPPTTELNGKENSLKAKPTNDLQNTNCIDACQSSVTFSRKNNINNVANNVKETLKLDALKSARKDLSLGDIRSRLASSSRLAELKASAARLSQGIQRCKELEAKKSLKEFKSIDVEVPSSPSKNARRENELLSPKKTTQAAPRPLLMSPRKVVISPVKSPAKEPAYIRHASLATTETSLPLPHHYRFLGELFRGMETVASLLYNRNEKITFSKLKPSVQEMLKRNFTEKHLAQIRHLVPDFYTFEVLKTKSFSNTTQKDSYELVISPHLPNAIKIMNPTVLLDRRRVFYGKLLQVAKQHHTKFLLTLDPPMIIQDSKLARWHPEFELEKIPDVPSSKLPEMPNEDKYSTAQDVLSKARELFKCNTKMERALEKLSQAKARGLTQEEKMVIGVDENIKPSTSTCIGTQTPQPSSNVTLLNPALRNLPAALLEKVKAKQAAKALEAMTRSTADEKKYLVYSRLPDLARTLRNIFVTERKNVLALSIVLSKLDSSFKARVSANNLHEDIKILSEILPQWLKLQEIRNNLYVKIDKNANLEAIKSKLEKLAEEYKNK